MNKGVEILLSRMESHPEEFDWHHRRAIATSAAEAFGRWDWVVEAATRRVENKHQGSSNYRLELPFLTNQEVDALYDKYMSIQGDAFTKRIMSELLRDEEEQEYDMVRMTTVGRYNIGSFTK